MSDPSPDLLAANERLLALREQLAQRRAQAAAPAPTEAHEVHTPANNPQSSRQPQDDAPLPDQPDTRSPAFLPPHLGWDSPAVTAALRARQAQNQSAETAVGPTERAIGPAETAVGPTDSTVGTTDTTVGPTDTTVGSRQKNVGLPETAIGPTNTIVGPTKTTLGSTKTTVSPTKTTDGPTGVAGRSASHVVGPTKTALDPDPTPAPIAPHPDSPHPPTATFPLPSAFPLHPSLALALLRQQQVATGRLWLLLRALDDEGRGWLNRADIEAAFTNPNSPSHFCTTRYLRQLLAAGDGLFWQREGSDASPEPAERARPEPAERARPEPAERACLEPAERKVWLRSQAKVAAALGIGRLRGRAVELPVAILLGPIGDLRAHLYASFHSSRGELAPPISRESLRELSGVSPRTQQSYDARAEVEVQSCLALGGLATVGNTQSHAWQHGQAAFTFTDHQGKQGAPGSSYQAHRLPNRYIGPHRRLTGKPKRLNRQLIDLRHKGYAGNGQPLASRSDGLSPKSLSDGLSSNSLSDESLPKSLAGGRGSNGSRRYYADGAAAGRVWLRQQGRVLVYWQANSRMANGRQPNVCFWYMLGTGAV